MPKAYLEKNYYHVRIFPSEKCEKIRRHDVGRPHSNIRQACKIGNKWKTQAWLISKENARRVGNTLVATNERTRKILERIRKEYGPIKFE